jgi:hypothetical protein
MRYHLYRADIDRETEDRGVQRAYCGREVFPGYENCAASTESFTAHRNRCQACWNAWQAEFDRDRAARDA